MAVYIAEAHFVERDKETNEIVDGWPVCVVVLICLEMINVW